MNLFNNPFIPYLVAPEPVNDSSGVTPEGSTFYDSSGNFIAGLHQFGNQTFLENEIGHHISTLSHLSGGLGLLTDSQGSVEAYSQPFGDKTLITDDIGNLQYTIEPVGDQLLVQDDLGHQIEAIHHVGNNIVADDEIGHQLWST